MSDGAWFAPKRFGIGVGWPLRWQGWALTALVMASALVADRLLMPGHRLVFAVVIALDAVAFGGIALSRTRGGWRWRWGETR